MWKFTQDLTFIAVNVIQIIYILYRVNSAVIKNRVQNKENVILMVFISFGPEIPKKWIYVSYIINDWENKVWDLVYHISLSVLKALWVKLVQTREYVRDLFDSSNSLS